MSRGEKKTWAAGLFHPRVGTCLDNPEVESL